MANTGPKRFRLAVLLITTTTLVALVAGYWLSNHPRVKQWRSQQQLTHALSRVEAVQQPLREFIERTSFWPNSALDARLEQSMLQGDDVIDSIRVGNSALLTVTFRADSAVLASQTLIFIPEKTADGAIRWRCDAGTVSASLRPAACRSRNPSVASTPAQAQLPQLPAAVREATNHRTDPLKKRAEQVRRLLHDRVNSDQDMRKKIAKYQRETGELPSRNQQINLPEPHRLADKHFRYIGLQSNGSILYQFSNSIAGMEGHRFQLVPAGLAGVWRCETQLPADHIPKLCNKQVL